MDTGFHFTIFYLEIDLIINVIPSPLNQGQRWTGKPWGRTSASCLSGRWTERRLAPSCCPPSSCGGRLEVHSSPWPAEPLPPFTLTPRVWFSCLHSPRFVNDGVFEGRFGPSVWRSVAATDVQFSTRWDVRSRHLEINGASKLVQFGLEWSAPCI